jgi:hypothetical protein
VDQAADTLPSQGIWPQESSAISKRPFEAAVTELIDTEYEETVEEIEEGVAYMARRQS